MACAFSDTDSDSTYDPTDGAYERDTDTIALKSANVGERILSNTQNEPTSVIHDISESSSASEDGSCAFWWHLLLHKNRDTLFDFTGL